MDIGHVAVGGLRINLPPKSQGQVELATQEARDGKFQVVRSQMHGDFKLADVGLNLSNLHYDIPGAGHKTSGHL